MQPHDRQRLEKISTYCVKIERTVVRCKKSMDVFLADEDMQQSISFSIGQIGELVGGLTEEYRAATKAAIQWPKIKAMRNIVVHDYGSIDLRIVWNITTTDIPELLRFCKEQLSNEEQD